RATRDALAAEMEEGALPASSSPPPTPARRPSAKSSGGGGGGGGTMSERGGRDKSPAQEKSKEGANQR
ncbi:MAG: hypothetical protein WBG41_04405, partial [Acidimicrobiales bacterium]